MEAALEDTQTLKEDLLLVCEKLAYQGQECVFLSVNILTEDTFCCGSHYGQEFLMKSSSIVELFMQFCKAKALSKAISIKTERKEHVSEQENATVKADVICISDSDEEDDKIKEILESVDQDMVSHSECKDFTTSSSEKANSRIDDCYIEVDIKRDKIDYQQNVSHNILNFLPSSKELSHNSSETMKVFEKEMELFDRVQTYQEVDIFHALSDVSGQNSNQESVKRHKDLINDAESIDIVKKLYVNNDIKHNNMSEFGDTKVHENEHIAMSERDAKLFSNYDEHTSMSEFNETDLREIDEHIGMSEIRETIFPQKGNASVERTQDLMEDSLATVNNKTVAGSNTKSLDFIHIDDGNLESSNNETSADMMEAEFVSSECQNKILIHVETETTIVKPLSVQNVDDSCMTYNASSDSLDNSRQSVQVGLNICENCGECFFSSKLLKIHVTSHCQEVEEENLGKQAREKTQNFNVCEKQFNRSDSFLTHSKTHDTMKSASPSNHECAVCCNVFSNNKLFRKDMGIHTDSHAVQSDSNEVQPDSPVVQPDSHAVQSDSHAVQSDFHVVQSDSHVVQSDSHVVQQDTNVVQPDSHVVQSDSPAVQSDSPAVQADSHAVGENKLSQQENSNSNDKNHINSETKNINSCVKSEKPKTVSKKFQCRYCLKNFGSTSYCIVHESKYCKIRLIQDGIRLQCRYCLKKFKSTSYCNVHESKYCKIRMIKDGIKIQKYQCDQCFREFKTDCYLVVHKKIHCKKRIFQETYRSKRQLMRNRVNNKDHDSNHIPHELTHKKHLNRCTVCSKLFSNKFSLRKHISIHTDSYVVQSDSHVVQSDSHVVQPDSVDQSESPAVQSDSPAVHSYSPAVQSDDGENKSNQQENSNSNDIYHINSETKNINSCVNSEKTKTTSKRFQCRYCLKNFRSTSYCYIHENKYCKIRMIKGGIKIQKYQCDQCFREFKTDCYLAVHKKIHCKKRIFQETYPSKRQLMRNQVNEEHDSNHFPREFTHKKHLNRCTVCSKLFSNKFSLQKHISIHTDSYVFQSNSHAVKSDSHVIQSDSHVIQSDSPAVQSDSHVIQSDFHAVQSDDGENTLNQQENSNLNDKSHINSETKNINSFVNSEKTKTASKRLQCRYCLKNFRSTSYCIIHESKYCKIRMNKDGIRIQKYQCDQCFREFKTDGYLAVHKKIHCKKRIFQKTCPSKRRLIRNQVNEEHDSNHFPREFTHKKHLNRCTVCSKFFSNKFSLRKHTSIHTDYVVQSDSLAVQSDSHVVQSDSRVVQSDSHAVQSDSYEVQSDSHVVQADSLVVQSDSCAVQSDSPAVQSYSHAGQSDFHAVQSDDGENKSNQQENSNSNDKNHTNSEMKNINSCVNSEKTKIMSKRLQCRYCLKNFKSTSYCIVHESKYCKIRINKDGIEIQKYQCDQCFREFKTDCYLAVHKKIHCKKRIFQKTYPSKRRLMNQVNEEHDSNHFPHELTNKKHLNRCTVCSKLFSSKFSLQKHIIHTDSYVIQSDSPAVQSDSHVIQSDSPAIQSDDGENTLSQQENSNSKDKSHINSETKNINSCVNSEKTKTMSKTLQCRYCLKNFRSTSYCIVHESKYCKIRRIKDGIKIQKYQCDQCFREFKTDCYLAVHKKMYCKKRIFQKIYQGKRQLCGFKASDKVKVKLLWKASHSKKNHTHKKYTCDICYQEFVQYRFLNAHKMKYHETQNRTEHVVEQTNNTQKDTTRFFKPYKCYVCYKEFDYYGLFKIHSKKCTLAVMPYQCKTCGKRCSQSNHLSMHLKSHKNVKCSKLQVQEMMERKQNTSTPKFKTYECKICGERCSHINNLNMHLRIHKNKDGMEKAKDESFYLNSDVVTQLEEKEKSFECGICNEKYSSIKPLEDHLTIHERSKNCFPNLPEMNENKDIIEVSQSKKLDHCHICLKQFTSPAELKSHLKIHAVGKLYECTVCLKTFHNRSVLKWHQATHSNNKSYECKVCQIKVFNFTSWKIHMKLHKKF